MRFDARRNSLRFRWRQPFSTVMNIRSAPAVQDTAVQEARESAAQTRREASSGDQQAVRKLAASSATQPAKSAGPVVNATPAGAGQNVKVTA